MSKKYQVSPNDMMHALHAWMDLYPSDGWHNLLVFLDLDDISITKNTPWGYELSELAYNKVRMLLSPHNRTLMQAFIIRTGYHRKLP